MYGVNQKNLKLKKIYDNILNTIFSQKCCFVINYNYLKDISSKLFFLHLEYEFLTLNGSPRIYVLYYYCITINYIVKKRE